VGTTAALPPTWTFAGPAGEVALRQGHEYMAYAGFPTETVRLDAAEVVFAGYGITAPEYDWDDFEGLDVRGKVLLVLNNDPDWDDALFAGRTRLYYGRWDYKYEQAARLGAAGCILVHTRPSAGYGWSVVQSSWGGEQFELPAQGGPRLQVRGWVTEEAAGRLVALAGRKLEDLVAAAHKREFRAVGLGITTSFEIPSTISRKTTANVLGVLRGSDPTLREQYVVFTAHHDHLGVGEPDSTGDRIYNGALDNASGVAQVLAIARALAALPERPRRSVLFLLVGAEESGLLGSEHYARHPTVPPERIAAVLNYDGAQIFGRSHDIVQLGRGKTTIDAYVDAVAALQGRKAVADLFPDRGFFYRSDHFSFARIGVPAVAFDAGMEIAGKPAAWGRKRMEAWEAAHYHRPSDEFASSWNLDGAVEDAQFGFYLGLALAQAPEMPAWTPGDEFEAARKGSHPAAGK
jgi:Zn-dependent M28 family amino/carboxypeptidase